MFVVNNAGNDTSAQYNYWGPYTDAEIEARMSSGESGKSGANVTFQPYVGQSLVDASLVVAVESQETNDSILDTYAPKAAIGAAAPTRDLASSLFIFPTLAGGLQSVQVTANQHESQSRNVNVIPGYKILAVLDVWEHAYYVDYKNLRPKYVESFWNNINWDFVSEQFDKVIQ